MKKETLLFDLDGTIIDSSQGIFASINYAMEKMGKKQLSLEVLRSFVGPPLMESFMKVGLTTNESQMAVKYYRELYKEEGMYLVDPYEQIERTLAKLAEEKALYIATSKPEYFATKILTHLDFSKYFRGIYGADLEGLRTEKTAVIRYLLDSEQTLGPEQTIMVGDRAHDILGAASNELDSIGVLYGFGSKKELQSAGATRIIANHAELLTIIK